ncbi:MAG: efflux RND transporter periplasmic adaptor subunit [Isosphaeraceae bacterium]
MSGSMFVGRVLLPGLGLALAGILAWQAWRGSNGESRVPFALASLSGSGALEPASPSAATAPQREEKRQPDSPSIILAEGHVAAYPGAEVVVGAELPGTITRILVQEKSTVRKGQLLVEFRGDAIRASAEEAVARVAQADAELSQIEQEQARANRLPEKQQGMAETRERLKARWNTAKARRAEAVAGYRRIEAEFAGTRVRSPIDGVVISRAVNPGETVNLGTPLLRIVDLTRLRIEAEVDAFDIPRCEPGCPVTISAQGYTSQSWQGTVEEIADSLIPRRIRPEDPGRPTDTRVLPVRIAFQQPTSLKLGQRVEVKIVEATSPKDGEPRATISSTRTIPPKRK